VILHVVASIHVDEKSSIFVGIEVGWGSNHNHK
jgi:hypothetical protein